MFNSCSSLTSFVVENGNPVYDSRDNCNAIIRTADNVLIAGGSNTIIPNSVTSIGRAAFHGRSSLTSITIPNSVTSIENLAFAYSGLTSVTIPNSVTNIEDMAFAYSSSLTSIIVESGNTVYDSRNNCNAIINTTNNELIAGCKSTIIPNTVTSIGVSAFEGRSSLTSITIPNSVTTIGDYAFYGCSGLTSVTIPNSVTSIYTQAFYNCQNLKNVFCFAETVPTTESAAFTSTYIKSATLHVPEGTVSLYTNKAPWSQFGTIVEIVPEKCATPTIAFANGKVRFASETEGVEFVSTVTCTPNKSQNGDELDFGGTFTISVYATKESYIDSDVATKTITMSQVGDIDADGQITITDVTSLVNLLLGK